MKSFQIIVFRSISIFLMGERFRVIACCRWRKCDIIFMCVARNIVFLYPICETPNITIILFYFEEKCQC